MRIATFNLESLETTSKAGVSLSQRAEVLRPQLERLRADIICLQEVNGQRVPGASARTLQALDGLLVGTSYAEFQRVTTLGPTAQGPADVHNLVILSRYPVIESREIRHGFVDPAQHRFLTSSPPAANPQPVMFERPVLMARIALPGGRDLIVLNVHFRAPLAAAVPGQKETAFVWKSIRGWAEGYYLSALKRSGQALELRLFLEQMFDEMPHAAIAVCGDFNAEDHETPLKIVIGAEEDTGNGLLAGRSMAVLDRALPADRRYSVLHHGRAQMLDHILVSRSLLGAFRSVEVHNETLEDEVVGYTKVAHATGSYHAPLVAEFALP